MHPNGYHIILSPEQWCILDELATNLQIIGEAATGKTELLKATMFKILQYFSIQEESCCPESKISRIFYELKQIFVYNFRRQTLLEAQYLEVHFPGAK